MNDKIVESGFVCTLTEKLTKEEEKEMREYLKFIRKIYSKPEAPKEK